MGPQKSSQKRGQFTIEYTTIAILVIAAILIGGPYVIRSINAYFRSAQQQTEDSFLEELRQEPPGNYIPGTGCDYTETRVCGDGTICGRRELYVSRVYTPAGCWSSLGLPDPAGQCIPDIDSICCDDPYATGLCTVHAIHGTNPDGTCPEVNLGGTLYGTMEKIDECGSDTLGGPPLTWIYYCDLPDNTTTDGDPADRLDPSIDPATYSIYYCTYLCIPNTPLNPVKEEWCDADCSDGHCSSSGLPSSLNTLFVDEFTECDINSRDDKCVAVCKDPFEADATNSKCDCPCGGVWYPAL